MRKILSNPETWPLNPLDSAQAKHRCLYVELNFLFKLGLLFSIKLEIADRYHKLYSQTECIYDSANKHTDNPAILNKQKEIKDLVKNILNEKTGLLKYF